MNLSVWTYPWDAADEGIDQVLETVRDEAGCNAISLATAYHELSQVRPHARGARTYIGEGGVIYFRPNLGLYGRIKPTVSRLVDEIDVPRRMSERVAALGMDLNSWTVLNYHVRHAAAYPDCAVHTAFGDRLPHAVCPAHPDVREYSVALCADTVSACDLRVIELESPGFLAFRHNKAGAPLGAWGEYLLSLCFCDSCIRRAGAGGAAARDLVRGELLRIMEGDSDLPPNTTVAGGLAAWRDAHPRFAAYLDSRTETVASLVGEIHEAVARESDTKVVIQGGPFEGFLDAKAMKEIVARIEGLLVAVYNETPEQAAATVARGKELAGDGELIVGVQTHHPEAPSSDAWRSKVRACIDGGATGLNFYNYGICTLNQLRGVRAVLNA